MKSESIDWRTPLRESFFSFKATKIEKKGNQESTVFYAKKNSIFEGASLGLIISQGSGILKRWESILPAVI
jgi:hypothetical protein